LPAANRSLRRRSRPNRAASPWSQVARDAPPGYSTSNVLGRSAKALSSCQSCWPTKSRRKGRNEIVWRLIRYSNSLTGRIWLTPIKLKFKEICIPFLRLKFRARLP
jgi:hypothetical protein